MTTAGRASHGAVTVVPDAVVGVTDGLVAGGDVVTDAEGDGLAGVGVGAGVAVLVGVGVLAGLPEPCGDGVPAGAPCAGPTRFGLATWWPATISAIASAATSR